MNLPADVQPRAEHIRVFLLTGLAALLPLNSPLAAVLAGPAVLFLIVRALGGGAVRLPFTGLCLAGVGLLTGALLAGDSGTLRAFVSTSGWAILALVLPVNLVDRHVHLLRFLRAWILMALVVAIAYLCGVTNALASPDLLATHMAASLLLVLLYHGYARRSGRRWLYAASPLLLAAIVKTGSAPGLLAVTAGVMVWALVKRPFRAFLSGIVLLMAGAMLAGIFPEQLTAGLARASGVQELFVPLALCALLLGVAIRQRSGPRRALQAMRPALAGLSYALAISGILAGFSGYFNGLLLLAGVSAAMRNLSTLAAMAPASAAAAQAPARLRFSLASLLFGLALMILSVSCATVGQGNTARAAGDLSLIETGTHWASAADFAPLKRLGYQFAVVMLDENPKHWGPVFDAAEEAGIRLVPGLYPYPYKWEDGDHWTITETGQNFLRFAAGRGTLVKAIYVFNEPYLSDPATGKASDCGALSPPQLRMLRNEIRGIFPGARIYHDLGQPGAWAPGAYFARKHPCIGDKYARTTGIADFAGVWYYPMSAGVYQRERMMTAVQQEIDYVSKEMLAQPVVLAQAFRCKGCDGAMRYPNTEEIRDMNCSLRERGPHAMSWYAWRQDTYEETLSARPDLWPMTGAGACGVAP